MLIRNSGFLQTDNRVVFGEPKNQVFERGILMHVFRPRWSFVFAVLAYTLLMRLTPYFLSLWGMRLDPETSVYPWNFSPIFAVCLFGGAFLQDRRLSIGLPMLVFLISDLGIWAITGRFDWAFYPDQPVVYLSLVLCAMLGFLLREKRSTLKIAGTGLAGCLAFYVLTNFAHWLTGTAYPHTPAGLVECYIAAIPYFRNSVLGTVVFSALLFSPICVREFRRHESTSGEQAVIVG